jgi:hypothetical protein
MPAYPSLEFVDPACRGVAALPIELEYRGFDFAYGVNFHDAIDTFSCRCDCCLTGGMPAKHRRLPQIHDLRIAQSGISCCMTGDRTLG